MDSIWIAARTCICACACADSVGMQVCGGRQKLGETGGMQNLRLVPKPVGAGLARDGVREAGIYAD